MTVGHADPACTQGPNLKPNHTDAPSQVSLHEDLLSEIQTLRTITQRLEQRVLQDYIPHEQPNSGDTGLSLSDSTVSESILHTPPAKNQVGEVVAQLQRVSMGASSLDMKYGEEMIVKIGHVHAIPDAPVRVLHHNKLLPCVWLPYHAEAMLLVDFYVEQLSYIQHVVHHPSIPGIVNSLYRQVDSNVPVSPGPLILLLSMIASATHVWTPPPSDVSHPRLLLTSAQANAQTRMWVTAVYTVLNAAQDVAPTLELIQGVIVLSFIIANLEGVSMRYRSLISTGLLLGREMNLHRLDDRPNAAGANAVEVELSRRVWWYLSATDWWVSPILETFDRIITQL